MEDEDIVSRSFLTVFFMDINNLKDALAGYRSLILRIEIKTTENVDKTLAKLSDDLKNALIQWSDSVRLNVERCHVAAVSLSGAIPEIKTEDIQETYENIMKQFTPNLEDVSKYTFAINELFVKGTLEKILNKMESFYEQFTKK